MRRYLRLRLLSEDPKTTLGGPQRRMEACPHFLLKPQQKLSWAQGTGRQAPRIQRGAPGYELVEGDEAVVVDVSLPHDPLHQNIECLGIKSGSLRVESRPA